MSTDFDNATPTTMYAYTSLGTSRRDATSVNRVVRSQTVPVYLRSLFRATKLVEDKAIAGALLFALSPLMLLIGLAIRLESPGPALFRQRRGGRDGRPFACLKFRTMTVMEDGSAIRQARRDDDRVTRIGRLLRRTSLDELPQLINVVRGDMSLIGPRPHALAHDAAYAERLPDYGQRQRVKPGLTGLAQVNGHRGHTDTLDLMIARVRDDNRYIDRWSPLLDLWILITTPAALLLGRRAW